VRGTEGWSNMLDVALVDPAIPVWRIEKGVFDMWAEPGLLIESARAPMTVPEPRDPFFDALKARGIDQAAVIGVAADYCVRWAIEGLIARDFRVKVPARLTRGIDRPIETVASDDFRGAAVEIEAVI
jgi:nicotinamidase/pyrazinamidase